ncbi:iron-containing alcohol dehydrogenase [Helcococcus kunzii]|uniref:iron-containing alcohol dehydrogenase n=1 Tax=Helcococcus kunzii TaxID=40091 RepID=UPI001BAEEF27|nr:iron-containing alcohol dehydrogenase [Helcococcus kunzii]QUY64053.1 iron-containing alcohol dehydrogenase [Helcococcus kunzii]
MKNCDLYIPGKIFYGENSLSKIKELPLSNEDKVCIFAADILVKNGYVKKIEDILNEKSISYKIYSDMPVEPSYSEVQKIVDDVRDENITFIIGVGGGSVMDAAKLVSILDTDEYNIKDLLDNPTLGKKTIKSLMIPSTVGTGSEATPNSIVLVPEDNLKVGIVNNELIPDYVILDPEVVKDLPKSLVASTGIDALCHNIECYTSTKANPISNSFAISGLELILKNIEEAALNPSNKEAKSKMLLGSFYGGVSITTSGTTAVHALSYPLGGKFHVPHGVSNAILLVPVLKYNKSHIEEELVEIFDKIYLTENSEVKQEDKADFVINKIERIVNNLDIPKTFAEFGVNESHIDELVNSSMKVTRLLNNNKKEVTPEDARSIYEQVI